MASNEQDTPPEAIAAGHPADVHWNEAIDSLEMALNRLIRTAYDVRQHNFAGRRTALQVVEALLDCLSAASVSHEPLREAGIAGLETLSAAATRAKRQLGDTSTWELPRPEAATWLRDQLAVELRNYNDWPERDDAETMRLAADAITKYIVETLATTATLLGSIARDLPMSFAESEVAAAVEVFRGLQNLDPDSIDADAKKVGRALLKALGYPDVLAQSLFRRVRNRDWRNDAGQ